MPSYQQKIKWGILGALAISTILVWLAVFFRSSSDEIKVNFYAVGEGDAILIAVPPDKQILIDGGPDKTILEKLGRDLPFYDREIEVVVSTHPDKDHLAGLVEVLKRYKVDLVVTNGTACISAICAEWDKEIAAKNIPAKITELGQKILIEQDKYLEILAPGQNFLSQNSDDNNNSIISRLIIGNDSFLFTGDAEKKEEQDLLSYLSADRQDWKDLQSDVLKVAHHGSKTSTTEEFLKAVSPEIAIIQVGRDNKYKHPSEEILKLLENFSIQVYRTDLDGDIKMITQGEGIKMVR